MSDTNTTANNTETEVWVIPCGGAKADMKAAARHLYTGSFFREALNTALANVPADRVFILSAKHGLLPLTTEVEPYDLRMGDVESVNGTEVAVQANRLGWNPLTRVQAFLPRKYLSVLEDAARWLGVEVWDTYEADAGIGEQKRTLKSIRNN